MDFDKTTLKRLRKLESQTDRSVDWYFEVGRLVGKLTPRPKSEPKESEHYRVGTRHLARELLGENVDDKNLRQCENRLYRARKFVDSFSLSERSTLDRLGPSKAAVLLRVRSKIKRKQLMNSCAKHNWSFREAQRRVTAANGEKLSPGRRPFEAIKFLDAAGALRDITLKSKQWLHHYECWFGAGTKLTRANLKRLSGPQKESLSEAYEKLGEVTDSLNKAQAALKQFCDA